MNPSYNQYSRKIKTCVLTRKNNGLTSGKLHAPKVMEISPETQIYAKQWT